MTVPMNTTVLEGHRVQLDCGAEARPANITYKWTRKAAEDDAGPAIDVTAVPDLSARVSFGDTAGSSGSGSAR